MGQPRAPLPVKLICGLLYADEGIPSLARKLLMRRFGPLDMERDLGPFNSTDYYADEMGPNLRRWFYSFERLIRPDALADIKLQTNEVEREMAEDFAALGVARPANLDPGYVDLSKLVLATTKDRSHRIYLGQRIHAEVTLQFADGRWQPLPWTYPDYRLPRYHEFFTHVRERLVEQRRALEGAGRSYEVAP